MKMSCLKFFCFLLSGCQSFQSGPVLSQDFLKIEPEYTLNEKAPDFVATNCTVYNLKTNERHFLSGRLCAFPEKGRIFFWKGVLSAKDAEGKLLWSLPNLNLNSVLRVSRDLSEILTIDTQYLRDQNKKCFTSAKLLVLDRKGKVIKSFNFAEFTKSRPMGFSGPNLNLTEDISCKGHSQLVSKTIVRHFEEFRDKNNPQKKGYMAFDLYANILFVFDESLEVVKNFSQKDRKVQAPVQVGNDKIVFYELVKTNASSKSATAYLTEFNLDDLSYRTFYRSPAPVSSVEECGSISILNAEQIFIGHSACVTKPAGGFFYTEVIDLKRQTSDLSKVKPVFTPSLIQPFFPQQGQVLFPYEPLLPF